MFLKKKKSLITLLVVFFATTAIALGLSLLAPKTQTAHAATETTCPYHDTEFTAGVRNLTTGNYYRKDSNLVALGTYTVGAGQTVNLCLNGYSIMNDSATLFKIDGGTLNIHDCSESKSGDISALLRGNAVVITNGGTLNLYDGQIWQSPSSNTAAISIGTETGADAYGNVNIYGGRVTGDTDNYAIKANSCTDASKKSAINIAGGKIENGDAVFARSADVYLGGSPELAGGMHIDGGRLYTKAVGGKVYNGTIKLAADSTLIEPLTVEKSADVDLDLNGHVLKYVGEERAEVVTVKGSLDLRDNGAGLNYIDCYVYDAENSDPDNDFIVQRKQLNGGIITGGTKGGVYVDGGVFNMIGGSISGNRTYDGASGGGVRAANNAAFYLNSKGIISFNYSAMYGGGVRLENSAFYMNSGSISSNVAQNSAGGVDQEAATESVFVMNGGTISDNKAIDGEFGGVCVEKNTAFTMNNGTIKNNEALSTTSGAGNGGGIGIISAKPVNIRGGTISGNRAGKNGGNVYIAKRYSGTDESGNEIPSPNVTMSEDTYSATKISGGSAQQGGGVYVGDAVAFTMSGGTISSNAATRDGGGVYAMGEFTMSNGTISGNSANYSGGGVYVGSSTYTFAMSGGVIGGTVDTDKNTANAGGGVYVFGKFKASGSPKILGNKNSADANNNIYLHSKESITVDGALATGAQLYVIKNGVVAVGFTQDGDPATFFKPDISSYNCVYVSDKATGTVNIGAHSGGTATCTAAAMCENCGESYGDKLAHDFTGSSTYKSNGTQHWKVCKNCTAEDTEHKTNCGGGTANCIDKAVCATCGQEYGDPLGHDFTALEINEQTSTKSYTAFDELRKDGMVVNAVCGRSGCGHKEEIADYTVAYKNGDCLHVGDTSVTIYHTVAPDKTLSAAVEGINVTAKTVAITWQYNLTSDDTTYWLFIRADTEFTYDHDRVYAVRATFTDGKGNNRTFREFNEHVSFKTDGKTATSIGNVGVYEFTLDTSATLFAGYSAADYNFTEKTASFEIKRAEIELNNTNNLYWLLQIDDSTTSALRDGYVQLIEDESGGSYYKYFSEGGEGRISVTRSIVRDRNKAVNIKLYGARAGDGVYTISYGESGELGDIGYTESASGKYTAYAVLTLANNNYEFIKTGDIAADRHMTAEIRGDGSVLISKEWYIAKIDNGLLSQQEGDTYGKEWSMSGWTYGGTVNNYAPRLEHGDPGAYGGTVEFGADNDLVTFELFKVEMSGTVNRVKLGETFNRYDFDNYINSSVPVGQYVLVVRVGSYTSIEHEHWFEHTNHDGSAAGIFYDKFTREFNFTVGAATLTANAADLNGKTFEYDYDGQLHLYGNTFTLDAPVHEREGIWANAEFNGYYGGAAFYYNLDRWSDPDNFIGLTGLNAIQNPSSKPVNADTYVVRFIVRAPNYGDVIGGADGYSFTVKINKAVVEAPDNITDTLMKKYVYAVPENATYSVKSGVVTTFTQAGTYDVVLKLIDPDNYAWTDGDHVYGDEAIITVTLVLHDHVYGDWHDLVPAACTATGTKGYKDCSICDKHFDENNAEIADLTIAATGHTEVVDSAVAPTCTENGKTEGKHCSVCHAVITAQREVAALGHDYGEWTVYRQATVDEFGEERRLCSHNNGHYETRQIPKRVSQLVNVDGNGGEIQIEITTPDGFAHNIELAVTEIAKENYVDYEEIAQMANGRIDFVYDVTLKSDGVEVQPDGTLTIKLLIPTELRGRSFKLFHKHDGTATETGYTVDGNYAVVNVDRLSEFIFVGERDENGNKSPNAVWIAFIVILSLAIVGEAGYIAYRKVRKNKATEDKA